MIELLARGVGEGAARELFDAMQRQASVAKPIDVLTLSETLRNVVTGPAVPAAFEGLPPDTDE